MRSRRLVLGLILLTLLATCLAAAAKLRATPKYDRIQVGMTYSELVALLGPESAYPPPPPGITHVHYTGEAYWELDEGTILVDAGPRFPLPGRPEGRVAGKRIRPRPPLERLAWLAGWR